MFDLEDGYAYIKQHESNGDFTKAVHEMAFVIKERAKETNGLLNIVKKYSNLNWL